MPNESTITDTQLLRAPQPCEGVTTTGWAIGESLRIALHSRANAQRIEAPGLYAVIERIECVVSPIPTHVAPFMNLFGPDGPLPQGLEWCLPDTGVALALPNVEGITDYLDTQGVVGIMLVIDRRYIDLIEDPGSTWPWDTQERLALMQALGIDTQRAQAT